MAIFLKEFEQYLLRNNEEELFHNIIPGSEGEAYMKLFLMLKKADGDGNYNLTEVLLFYFIY